MEKSTKISFKELIGKSIIGNMGGIIGTVTDVVFDENTGKILSLDIEPSEQSPIPPSGDCYRLIPYRIVLAIKNVVVVDESKINSIKIIDRNTKQN
ncbi:MAG TPA: hypothetical protein EYG76_05130 [Methanothermococcus okinawensis]|uniref:PRC-barrel domain-containing protein n=1 Tax=Methanothermococcus okinawensis TaxID=155863 RepID=A0A832YUI0_9EURY|nr:hypothetical protein [Methanothermococcus okinawensis]